MAIRLSTHELDENIAGSYNHHSNGNVEHAIPHFKNSPSPKTISSIVRRIRALLLKLLPVEVEEESIQGQEGILDQNVVLAFSQAAGDFGSVLPFCLLMARKSFINDAEETEYNLNTLRALACEVLATRVVSRAHKLFLDGKIKPNFRYPTEHCLVEKFVCCEQNRGLEGDGVLTYPQNSLELAVDQRLVIFLSSSSVQHVVDDLWKGRLVRTYKADGTSKFVPSPICSSGSFISHYDPSRLAVPRNYYYLQVFIWMIFIGIYTLVMRTYGDGSIELMEIFLWIFVASYLLEDLQRWIRQKSMDYFTLWNMLDLATDILYLISITFRAWSLLTDDETDSGRIQKEDLHLKSFQFLALLAPLLWFQLLKAFDVVQFFGIILVVMTRMLGEAGTFAVLLVINSIGFGQALYALDASDPEGGILHPTRVLLETFAKSIIGVVDFNLTASHFGQPFGQILFYIASFVSRLLLATILTALFSTAYATVQKSSNMIFASYFSEKVIGLIKNPDQHVYFPPLNLLEVFIIGPLEFILPRKLYSKLNVWLQYLLFSVPMALVALYEIKVDFKDRRINALKDRPEVRDNIEAVDQRSRGSVEDPEIAGDEENKHLKISRIKFEDLVRKLPDVQADEPDQKHLGEDPDETLTASTSKDSVSKESHPLPPVPKEPEPSMEELLDELMKLRKDKKVSNLEIMKGLKGLTKKA